MSGPRAYFVTGTDTDAGKTLVACGILAAARARGMTTAAVKPVAAGVTTTASGNWNADVLALAAQCTPMLANAVINPVCFDEPVAPHIAAARSGTTLSAAVLAENCRQVMGRQADLTLIEGAGGWKVPLNGKETLADVAVQLQVPVILVVGMRLGCLNHALLTAQAIESDGLRLAGWVANRLDARMPVYRENLDTLLGRLPAPLLGEIPALDGEFAEMVRTVATMVDLDKLR